MPGKIKYVFFFYLILTLTWCHTVRQKIIPPSTPHFQSLKAKIFLKNEHYNFSGKILLSYNRSQDKILFITPLNQVYLKLQQQGENSVLINFKQKKYWLGNFSTLFKRISMVSLKYSELKNLIMKGMIPRKKLKKHGIAITIEPRPQGKDPLQIIINGHNLKIKFKILRKEIRKGRISFNLNLEGMQETLLDSVIQN